MSLQAKIGTTSSALKPNSNFTLIRDINEFGRSNGENKTETRGKKEIQSNPGIFSVMSSEVAIAGGWKRITEQLKQKYSHQVKL